jgi:hypothetical protein
MTMMMMNGLLYDLQEGPAEEHCLVPRLVHPHASASWLATECGRREPSRDAPDAAMAFRPILLVASCWTMMMITMNADTFVRRMTRYHERRMDRGRTEFSVGMEVDLFPGAPKMEVLDYR